MEKMQQNDTMAKEFMKPPMLPNDIFYNKNKIDIFKPIDIKGWDKFQNQDKIIDSQIDISQKIYYEKTPMTDEYKVKLKEDTGWSDSIIDSIGSVEEAEIYKNAGLVEEDVNGRPCLIKTDIDMDQLDERNRTNKDRMEQGLAPLDKNGKPIELHHVGQKADGPLAELTNSEHHSGGNDTILHDKSKTSEIDRDKFSKERAEHWADRAEKITQE